MQLLEMSCRVKALQLGFLLTKHETYITHSYSIHIYSAYHLQIYKCTLKYIIHALFFE